MKNKSVHIILLFASLVVLLLAFTGKDLINYHAIIGWGGFIFLTSINIILMIKSRR